MKQQSLASQAVLRSTRQSGQSAGDPIISNTRVPRTNQSAPRSAAKFALLEERACGPGCVWRSGFGKR